MPDFSTLIANLIENKPLLTLIALVVLLLLRAMILKLIRHDTAFVSDEQRKSMFYTKNLIALAIFSTIIGLWWSEIQHAALSVAAIAVALVLASKELILCFSGSILRASSRAFTVGDWIEMDRFRGEVLEVSILSTSIQEINLSHNSYEYTGKTITVPNSTFLSHAVKNLNFMKRYVYHYFVISTPPLVDPFPFRQQMLENLAEYCADFFEVAMRYNAVIERRAGVDLPGPEPHMRVLTTNLGDIQIDIRIFCPTEVALEIEQKVTADYMAYYHAELAKQRSEVGA